MYESLTLNDAHLNQSSSLFLSMSSRYIGVIMAGALHRRKKLYYTTSRQLSSAFSRRGIFGLMTAHAMHDAAKASRNQANTSALLAAIFRHGWNHSRHYRKFLYFSWWGDRASGRCFRRITQSNSITGFIKIRLPFCMSIADISINARYCL